MTTEDFEVYMAAKHHALVNDDLAIFRELLIGATGALPSSDEVVIMAFHKTRVDSVDVPEQLRRVSATWLHTRGFTLLGGRPAPAPNEPLPE